MTRRLGFLHTLEPNIEVFEELSRALGWQGEIVHRVEETAIDEMRTAGGVTRGIEGRVRAEIEALIEFPVDLVVCSCSAIGAIAESMDGSKGVEVQRIDRAMADEAVAAGQRIAVIASLPSSIPATRALLESSAEKASRTVEIDEIVADTAWARYQEGDHAGYCESIAEVGKSVFGRCDAIVLAQASMADAADLMQAAPIPVLSSPRLGIRRALDALQGMGPTTA